MHPVPNTPGANTPGANTPGANTSGANTPGANTLGANTPRASTTGTNTSGANIPGANTPGANTSGTNTSGANTPGANKTGANTPGTNTQQQATSSLGVKTGINGKHIEKRIMSIWRRTDIHFQTGKIELYQPVLPLVIQIQQDVDLDLSEQLMERKDPLTQTHVTGEGIVVSGRASGRSKWE
ncbi:hypothetical protein HGM15179_001819 [Zosterops borbonicus]|uniref:Uncharacterized protein n=1 Tax=Zosterops borbonicus TaxID=364589 RepID=A0A8K1LTB5_9PASS|nr:hypothetical protein HGM15179_001819 [Zosterops borbonicus]